MENSTIVNKYEEKFNMNSNVRVDESWNRYLVYRRYDYSIRRLYGNVLDVGSGDGFGAYLMSENPKIKTITCLEIQDRAIDEAKKNLKGIKNITIIKGIGEEMPFKKKFDSIHCGSTLEHAFDDRAILREIKRLLKGIAVISVPIRGGISLQHVREYTTNTEFLKLISEYFEIVDYRIFPKAIEESSLVVIVK